MIELISKALLLGVVVPAGVLLFSPYEAFLEGIIALVIVVAVVVGFLMYPRREVFYLRTTIGLILPDGNRASEHDLMAVRVELTRLWMLFVPTFLAVAFLAFSAAGGPAKFSSLNWIFSSRFAFIATAFCIYPPLLGVSEFKTTLLAAPNGTRFEVSRARGSFTLHQDPQRPAVFSH